MATNQAGSYVALEMAERKPASEGSLRASKNDDEIGGELDEVFWMKVCRHHIKVDHVFVDKSDHFCGYV